MARWFEEVLQDARDKLVQANELIEDAHDSIQGLQYEQEDKNENFPENLKGSSRYEEMEEKSEAFESIAESLESLDISSVIDEIDSIG